MPEIPPAEREYQARSGLALSLIERGAEEFQVVPDGS